MHVSMARATKDCANYRVLSSLRRYDAHSYVMGSWNRDWQIHQALNEETVLVKGWILLEDSVNMECDIVACVDNDCSCVCVDCTVNHEGPLLRNYFDSDVLGYMWWSYLCRQDIELVVEHASPHENDQ